MEIVFWQMCFVSVKSWTWILFDEWQRGFFYWNLLVALFYIIDTCGNRLQCYTCGCHVSCFTIIRTNIRSYNKLFMTWWITAQTGGGCDNFFFCFIHFSIFEFSFYWIYNSNFLCNFCKYWHSSVGYVWNIWSRNKLNYSTADMTCLL